MKFTQGSKHEARRAVDEIIFRRNETEIICDDGQRFGVGTVDCDRPPQPLTFEVYAEMYFEELHGEYKDYLN